MFRNLRGVRTTALRAVAVTAASSALLLMAQSGTANAAWKNGPMFNEAKQQCLDAGGYISTYPCNGSGAQWWHDISPAGANYYQLQTNSGYCLDPGVGSNNGEGPCNGGDYQHWTKGASKNINGQTYYVFVWSHDSRKCLDGGQTGNAVANWCNGSAYQFWLWN
ncbi:hypothetical protein ATKI12_3974 [Kitasatospora sp. Ki12]